MIGGGLISQKNLPACDVGVYNGNILKVTGIRFFGKLDTPPIHDWCYVSSGPDFFAEDSESDVRN